MDALRRQPAFERMGFHGARGARRLLAIPEQDEARNAADVVAHRHLRVRLGIDLGEAHARAQLGGHLLEHGRHHLAGATPVGPEVDQHRQAGAGDEAVEAVSGQIERLAWQDQRAAFAAFGGVGQAIVRHAVDGEAVRAGEFHRDFLEANDLASRWWRAPENQACTRQGRSGAIQQRYQFAGGVERRGVVETANVGVADEYLRHGAAAAGAGDHLVLHRGVEIDADLFDLGDAAALEQALGGDAVWAYGGAVQD